MHSNNNNITKIYHIALRMNLRHDYSLLYMLSWDVHCKTLCCCLYICSNLSHTHTYTTRRLYNLSFNFNRTHLPDRRDHSPLYSKQYRHRLAFWHPWLNTINIFRSAEDLLWNVSSRANAVEMAIVLVYKNNNEIP